MKPWPAVKNSYCFGDYDWEGKEMKVTVDKDLCIACGTCIDLCPGVFDPHSAPLDIVTNIFGGP
ncbi:hypothetical protein hamaS1_21830 [Moorella sp. Hama-1]|nr:hypothetical protein hamaS1_21830 [Moorella sp. Hama-1]